MKQKATDLNPVSHKQETASQFLCESMRGTNVSSHDAVGKPGADKDELLM